MRVLVVDDDANLRLTLGLLLRARGFAVEQAANGEEALRRLAEGGFDAVVSDVRMGAMSGVDLACRAKRQWPDLKVILMSGFCYEKELAAAAADIEGFAEKPPDVERLVTMLTREKVLTARGAEG